jgi:hypothetical protein
MVGTNILEEPVAPSSTPKIDTKDGGTVFLCFEDGNDRFIQMLQDRIFRTE